MSLKKCFWSFVQTLTFYIWFYIGAGGVGGGPGGEGGISDVSEASDGGIGRMSSLIEEAPDLLDWTPVSSFTSLLTELVIIGTGGGGKHGGLIEEALLLALTREDWDGGIVGGLIDEALLLALTEEDGVSGIVRLSDVMEPLELKLLLDNATGSSTSGGCNGSGTWGTEVDDSPNPLFTETNECFGDAASELLEV